MKISKKELVRLIKEEISNLFSPEDEREAATAGIDPLDIDNRTGAVHQIHLSPLEKRIALQAKAKQKARNTARAMRVDEQPKQMHPRYRPEDTTTPTAPTASSGSKPQAPAAPATGGSAVNKKLTPEEEEAQFSKMGMRLGVAEAYIRKLVKEELSRLKK